MAIAASLASSATADVTITLQAQTFGGFQFVRAVDYSQYRVVGTLTGATINVVLDATVAYTYADDLCVYVDVEPWSSGGRLQVGGFSSLSAAQRHHWPICGCDDYSTSAGAVQIIPAVAFVGDRGIDGTIWIGNGYGAAATSGTWTGTVTLHGLDLICSGGVDSDGDGTPDCVDNCVSIPGPCSGCPAGPCGNCGSDPDADGDGYADCVDNCPNESNPLQADCDGDGAGDACDQDPDCNRNGRPDACDISDGTSPDIDSNGVPDACQPDCNANGSLDTIDIQTGFSTDCEPNGIPDECEMPTIGHSNNGFGRLGSAPIGTTIFGAVASGVPVRVRLEVVADLGAPTEFVRLSLGEGDDEVVLANALFQLDGLECPETPQATELAVPAEVWNHVVAASAGSVRVTVTGSPLVDAAQCANGTTSLFVWYRAARPDCDADGLADSCEIGAGAPDCNENGRPDSCDVAAGGGWADLDGNGVPDRCEVDCDGDTRPDAWEIAVGTATDCDRDGLLDECEVAAGASDCNADGVPDACELADGSATDVDGDGQLDECQPDCNSNRLPDRWEIDQGLTRDCDGNYLPDPCETGAGAGDCDVDGIMDRCEVGSGAFDKDGDLRPDSCEYAAGDFDLNGQIDGGDLGYLLAIWSLPGQTIGDLNGDGTINGADLGLLLYRWGPVNY